jgi:hypothetical protein
MSYTPWVSCDGAARRSIRNTVCFYELTTRSPPEQLGPPCDMNEFNVVVVGNYLRDYTTSVHVDCLGEHR